MCPHDHQLSTSVDDRRDRIPRRATDVTVSVTRFRAVCAGQPPGWRRQPVDRGGGPLIADELHMPMSAFAPALSAGLLGATVGALSFVGLADQ